MSISNLTELCRTNLFSYEVLKDDVICLKTSATHGTVQGLFLREMQGDWLQGAAEFCLIGRNIPLPHELCSQVTEFTEKALDARYDGQARVIYIRGSFQKKSLQNDIELFADLCEDFSAMLDRVEQMQDWDGNLLKLTFTAYASVH